MPSDLDISRGAVLRPIAEIGAQLGLDEELLDPYGRRVAKVSLEALGRDGGKVAGRDGGKVAGRDGGKVAGRDGGKVAVGASGAGRGRYVVVTAITPTPLGEGKTTTTVGLGQAFGQLEQRSVVAIRQPSLGPTFGIKGGAAGGGYAQVAPMEALNLHLTGDMHAVTAAHNLLAAMIDNHLHQGNALGLDPHAVAWRRVLDSNDRDLRHTVTGLGPRADGTPRETGFDITAASEVMAALALSRDLADLRARLGRLVVGWTRDNEPVTAEDLRAAGAMTVLLREALQPNLLQTIEQTPVLVHCGPFGNIAHGNSSIVADRIGLAGADYVVTEAGFGADMGFERFCNIKCRASGLAPDAAVIVATVRGLKAHSGRHTIVAGRELPPELLVENPDEVRAGAANLRAAIATVRRHGVTPVVAVNGFASDHASERQAILDVAAEEGVRAAVATHVADGGKGAVDLAEAVAEACDDAGGFQLLYPDDAGLADKIDTVAREVYGADGIELSATASRQLAAYEDQGWGRLPVCIAKTHLSLSADPALKGAPRGWTLPVREVRASVGAGFVYPVCGDMRTMPGLSSAPAAERIDIDEHGRVVGLS